LAATTPDHRDSEGPPPRQRRPISDDRFISRLHDGVPTFFLVAYLCFLVYCSLLPFGASSSGQRPLNWADWSGMTTRSAGLKDIMPNILLYVPLGAGAYVVARRRGWGRLQAAVCGIGLSAGTSMILELLQQLMPLRISSWVDVVSNTIGALVGALLGGTCRRFVNAGFRRGRFELRHMPISTTLRAYAAVLILAGLIPLDFTYDLHRLARAAKKANLVPFSQLTIDDVASRQAGLAPDLPAYVTARRIKVDLWLDIVAEAAAFGLLGGLLALCFRREHNASRFQSWLSAATYAALAALVLSVLQFFILSRGFDATAVVVRAFGACVGASVAVLWVGGRSRPRPDPTPFGPPGTHSRFAGMMAGGVLAYVLCRGLSPFLILPDAALASGAWREIGIIPFAGYFHSAIYTSADDILRKVLRYAVLGGLTSLAIGLKTRRSTHRRAWRLGLCCAAIAAVIELCQIYLPTRWCDMTHVMLAALGGYSGVIAARWLNDYYHAVRGDWAVKFRSAGGRAVDAASTVLNVDVPPLDDAAPKELAVRPQPAPSASQGKDDSSLNVEIPPPDDTAPEERTPDQTPSKSTPQDGDPS